MRPCRLIAGTEDGIRIVSIDGIGSVTISDCGLEGNAVRAIAINPDDTRQVLVGCGLRGRGLFRSDDAGATFTLVGFENRWVWGIAFDPGNTRRILIGTEPPMLFESLDGGRTFCDYTSIDDVESRSRWTFFHPPFYAGHVHAIGLSSNRPDRILAGIEHGGLLLSNDRGESWTDVMPGADMHVLSIAPASPDRIYAGAGNGLHISDDGGETWMTAPSLKGKYVHGIEIDGSRPERMFAYVDSQQSPVYRSSDSGETWTVAGSSLPSSRPADPVRLHPADGKIIFYAGDEQHGSRIFWTANEGETWQDLGVSLPKVWRLATARLVEQY